MLSFVVEKPIPLYQPYCSIVDVKLFYCFPRMWRLVALSHVLKWDCYLFFEIQELLSLTPACISQITFSFQGNYYRQSDDLSMGSSLSPIIADINVHYFEFSLFNKSPFNSGLAVLMTLLLWQLSHNIDNIVNTMNSVDRNIQFTYETENSGSLLFLYTLLTRTVDGFFTSVYRKSFAVILSLPFHHACSCHPPSQKKAAFFLLS